MAGPGGHSQRTDSAPPHRADESGASLKEHVLVAAFPDETPEVHVASLLPEQGQLLLREASIRDEGSVSLGKERSVILADVESIDLEEAAIALLGTDGQVLVQLHLESVEDQRIWAEGIQAVIGCSSAPEDTDDGDAHMLKARSQQLQNKIGKLEAISERRDSQLQKMLSRLDGAMKMMDAVQDMCIQQKRVVDAQKVAIAELQDECEEDISDSPRAAKPTHAVANTKGDRGQAGETEGAIDESQMAALLKMLLQDSDGQSQEHRQAAKHSGTPCVTSENQAEEATEEALGRLGALEAEKERYEGMLNDSQQEHMELLSKLDQMRSLMAALGVQEPED